MKTDWNTKLMDNYPLAFKNTPEWQYKNFECDAGWLTIIERLFDSIEAYLQKQPKGSKILKKIKVLQVKEKFGSLCIYVEHADDHINSLISQTKQTSKQICERCAIGGRLCKRGWIFKTLCKDCQEIHAYEMVESDA